MTALARSARACMITFAFALSACSAREEPPAAPPAILVDGSSTVFPLSQAVVQSMTGVADAPAVTVNESGTAAGFTKLCAGEVDIVGASRPIQTREMIACFRAGIRYVEAPVAFDGLTVIVHPSNPVNAASLADLALMWQPDSQATITNWRLVNGRWPDRPLALYGPGAQSGTFEYFKEAVIGVGASSRTDYTASEDDTVIVEGVANDPNGLGYLGHAYFERNRDRLKALAVDAGGGAGPIEPTTENIASGAYSPLSRPIFIYVNRAALDRPEVARFVEHYLNNAQRLSAEVGYVPLPESAYATYLERVQSRRVGTAFSGRSATGLTIEQVIAAPLIEPMT